ncbi:MAG: futalosine hydrolase [Bacteroidales bacterium]
MKVLIAVADKSEINTFLKKCKCLANSDNEFFSCNFNNVDIDILITGVGVIPMAVKTTQKLLTDTYSLAINVGVCGAYNRELPLGEVVVVAENYIPELGYTENGIFSSANDLNIIKHNEFPFINSAIRFDTDIYKIIPTLINFKQVTSNTVSLMHADTQKALSYRADTKADIETMEGASFMYACKCANVPFVEIRAVSNYVEKRDKEKWNMELAIGNLSEILELIIGG